MERLGQLIAATLLLLAVWDVPADVDQRLLDEAIASDEQRPPNDGGMSAPVPAADGAGRNGEVAGESAPDAQTPDRGQREVDEEMVVEGIRLVPDRIRPLSEMLQLYTAHGRGAALYRQKRYAEARPYIEAAAAQGFKMSQFRLAYMYRRSLGGIKFDGNASLGWLGVAADGRTAPQIRRVFRQVWTRVPETRRPEAEALIASYVVKYGSDENRLACIMRRHASSYIKQMGCHFKDEHIYQDMQQFVDDLTADTSPVMPVPGGAEQGPAPAPFPMPGN
jgi:hypothetical protein